VGYARSVPRLAVRCLPLVAWTLLAGCVPQPQILPSVVHPLRDRIWDVRAARYVERNELFGRLASRDYVLLGEKHDNARHHAAQALVIDALVVSGRRPAVAFETLSADVDAALARPLPTAASVRAAVRWDESGWPAWRLYEPVFRVSVRESLPLATANLHAGTLGRLRAQGLEGLDASLREYLGLEGPVPAPLRASLAEDVRAGHCGLLPESAVPRLVDVQLVRDAWMATALGRAAAASRDGAVLVAGAGHVRSDWGVPWHLRRADPGASVASLGLLEVPLHQEDPVVALAERFDGVVPYDFVWWTDRVDDVDPCVKYREQLRALRERSGS